MSIAARHGKLRFAVEDDGTRFRRLEDLLTADVFGAYRYLPPGLGLLLLLEHAQSANGESLRAWAEERKVPWSNLRSVAWAFWPSLDQKEPDLLAALGSADDPGLLAVLIEVKLHADQHEIDGVSQLGFYGAAMLDDLFDEAPFDFDLPRLRPVVLMTKDTQPPVRALVRARRELGDHYALGRTDAFWVSWTTAATLAATALLKRRRERAPQHELALLEDLVADLAERGFGPPRALASLPMPTLAPLPLLPSSWSRLSAGPRASSRPELRGLHLNPIDSVLARWRLR